MAKNTCNGIMIPTTLTLRIIHIPPDVLGAEKELYEFLLLTRSIRRTKFYPFPAEEELEALYYISNYVYGDE